MKRVISLLLVCVFMLTALVACSTKPEETEKPTAAATTDLGTNQYGESEIAVTVPKDLTFDGLELTVLTRGKDRAASEFEKLDETADSSDLDLAIEKRNEDVLSQLDLVVNYEKFTSYTNFNDYCQNYHQTLRNGEEIYDVVAHFAYAAAYEDIRGTLANMLDKDIFPYFNFDQPCWNQAMKKNLSANNKLYLISGDMNLTLFDTTMIMWHNKDLYDSLKNSDDPADLQDVALAGEFTFEVLYRWADVVGSESVDKTCQKTYGFGNATHFFDTLPHAWDLTFVTQAQDGRYQFNIEGNQKAENALLDVRDIMDKKGVLSHVASSAQCTCDDGMIGHFANGTLVFLCAALYNGEEGTNKIRDMSAKYCVLPIPKYDADQAKYGTTSADNYNVMSCVRNSTVEADGAAISAWLQLMNEKSYTNVRSYYINGIVKPRYIGTDDSDGTVSKSIELLDIILANVEYDLATIYSASLNDIGWLWRDLVAKTPTLSESFNYNDHSNGGVVKTKEQYLEKLASFNSFIFGDE